MTRLEILQKFYPNGDISKRSTQDISRYITYENELIELTSFLPQNTSLHTRLFYIKLDQKSPQLCSNINCNELVLPGRNNQFNKFCSNTCQRNTLKHFEKSNQKRQEEAIAKRVKCEYCNKEIKKKQCSRFACKLISKYNIKSPKDLLKIPNKNYYLEILKLLDINYQHINWTTNPIEIVYCVANNITELPKSKFISRTLGYKKIEPKYKFFENKKDLVYSFINTYGKDASKFRVVREFFGVNYAEQIYLNYNKAKVKYCKVCGNKVKFRSFLNPYSETCSRKCSNIFHSELRCASNKKRNAQRILEELKMNKLELLDSYQDVRTLSKFKCLECDTLFEDTIMYVRCPNCYPKLSGLLTPEIEIKDFIESLGIRTEKRRFPILNEIDIFVPSLNIGFEYNGLYWHSEEMGKGKYYHLNKQIEANKLGLDLIHIFEHQWLNKKDIIKSIIKAKLNKLDKKCYAREVEIKSINSNIKNLFLEENHIQGKDKSSIKLGAYYKDELVSVMTFGSSVYKKGEVELKRFCTLKDYHIPGMFSKFLKHYNKTFRKSDEILISYADLSRNPGNKVYEKFSSNSEITQPSYWYFKGNEVYHRSSFMKHKLKDKLNIYDKNLSEYENMINNGYNRYWDCGTIKYYL